MGSEYDHMVWLPDYLEGQGGHLVRPVYVLTDELDVDKSDVSRLFLDYNNVVCQCDANEYAGFVRYDSVVLDEEVLREMQTEEYKEGWIEANLFHTLQFLEVSNPTLFRTYPTVTVEEKEVDGEVVVSEYSTIAVEEVENNGG